MELEDVILIEYGQGFLIYILIASESNEERRGFTSPDKNIAKDEYYLSYFWWKGSQAKIG
jgi:hypothetical protein